MYYDFNDMLSRNGVYNMIVGGRGIGKTFGAKEHVIRHALTKGHEFVFVRRFDSEIKTSINTFFDDVDHLFPDHRFKADGSGAYVAGIDEEKPAWRRIGIFVALSMAHTLKSGAYPRVRTIIFDEFISEKGRNYLPDEFNVFNNLYNSVDRFQDRVRVIFMANSVSIMNPYFLALNIAPDEGSEWYRGNDGFVIAHFPDAAEYKKMAMGTRFGRFISGTEYGDFALGNEFKDGNRTMIGSKTDRAQYWYTLDTKRGVFTVWLDMTSGEMFILSRRPKVEDIYTLDLSRVSEERKYMSTRDGRLVHLKQLFTRAMVKFDKPVSRNAFLEIMK